MIRIGMEIKDYDLALKQIEQLGSPLFKNKKIAMHLTLTVDEAAWISKLLYSEIEMGIIEAEFNIKQSKHSLECVIYLVYVFAEHVAEHVAEHGDSYATGTAIASFGERSINRLRHSVSTYLNKKRKKLHKEKKRKEKKRKEKNKRNNNVCSGNLRKFVRDQACEAILNLNHQD